MLEGPGQLFTELCFAVKRVGAVGYPHTAADLVRWRGRIGNAPIALPAFLMRTSGQCESYIGHEAPRAMASKTMRRPSLGSNR